MKNIKEIKKTKITEYIKTWLTSDNKLRKKISNNEYTLGWTNEIFKRKKRTGWIITIDYDKKKLKEITKNCKTLQKKMKLGPGIIFKTTNGYHLYILDIITKKTKLKKIIEQSKGDKLYLQIGKKSNWQFNIRLGPKNGKPIKYVKIIPSKHKNKTSKTHLLFLCAKHPKLYRDIIKKNLYTPKLLKKYNVKFTIYRIKKPSEK